MASRRYRMEARGEFKKICPVCNEEFTLHGLTEKQADQHVYCSPNCKKKMSNRLAKELRDRIEASGEVPAPKPRRMSGGKMSYALECDPWATGQLPKTVTQNALWG